MAEFDEEEEHIEDDGEAIWLMSLADMMTLLFTLFVVMYAASIAEDVSGGGLAESMAKSFGGEVEIPHEELLKALAELLKEKNLADQVEVTPTKDGTMITFTSSVLFESGAAEVSKSFSPVINEMVTEIKKAAPYDLIRVEGHTDSAPIRSIRYPSNWELSGARASTLIRLFEKEGFPSQNLTAIGFGETRPLFDNVNESGEPIPENMAKNRRVVLKIKRGRKPASK